MQSKFNTAYLDDKGLNIHSISNLTDLPETLLANLDQVCESVREYRQIIVVGHLGKRLWLQVKENICDMRNPIDDFTVKSVHTLFETDYKNVRYQLLYPSDFPIDLQQLGLLSGWHYESPFKVGINDKWGSWFAYRAVILADSDFETTDKLDASSPCVSCVDQVCISVCPSNALDGGNLDFQACIDYRKINNSECKESCLARVACPVAPHFKYDSKQINYHYGVSMKTINELY